MNPVTAAVLSREILIGPGGLRDPYSRALLQALDESLRRLAGVRPEPCCTRTGQTLDAVWTDLLLGPEVLAPLGLLPPASAALLVIQRIGADLAERIVISWDRFFVEHAPHHMRLRLPPEQIRIHFRPDGDGIRATATVQLALLAA